MDSDIVCRRIFLLSTLHTPLNIHSWEHSSQNALAVRKDFCWRPQYGGGGVSYFNWYTLSKRAERRSRTSKCVGLIILDTDSEHRHQWLCMGQNKHEWPYRSYAYVGLSRLEVSHIQLQNYCGDSEFNLGCKVTPPVEEIQFQHVSVSIASGYNTVFFLCWFRVF